MKHNKVRKYLIIFLMGFIICFIYIKRNENVMEKSLCNNPVYIQTTTFEWYKYLSNGEIKRIELPYGVGNGIIRIFNDSEKFLGVFFEDAEVKIVEVDCATQAVKILLDYNKISRYNLDTKKIQEFQYQPDTGNISFLYEGIIYLIDTEKKTFTNIVSGVFNSEKEEDEFCETCSYYWIDQEDIVYIDEKGKVQICNIANKKTREVSEFSTGLYYFKGGKDDIYFRKTERVENLMFYNILKTVCMENIMTGKIEKVMKLGKNEFFCGLNSGTMLICRIERNAYYFVLKKRLSLSLHFKVEFFENQPFKIRQVVW